MSDTTDLGWEGHGQRIVLSPDTGGRIISWRRGERELVMAPLMFEGGLLRVLFAEEQYPGSSYSTPHRVLAHRSDSGGFRTHLRHYWNASNAAMRLAGWPEKANELIVDGLVLDKVVTFDASNSTLLCEVTITNTTADRKHLTPWLHHSFEPWPRERWMVSGGERREYLDSEIYWGSHLVEPGRSMRMVHADAAGELFAVLGAATGELRGMAGLLPIPGEFHQSSSELRYRTIDLGPGQRWRANSFLAVTKDWKPWATGSPVELQSGVEPAGALEEAGFWPGMLERWMLPAERARGLMVLSFLDKPPFFSASRYAASHSFAGFRPDGDGAAAWVMLYAPRDLRGLQARLDAPAGWSLQVDGSPAGGETMLTLKAHVPVRLTLHGPGDLRGKESAAVHLRLESGETITLRVPSDVTVSEPLPYHTRQTPIYLEKRWDDRQGPGENASPAQVRAWQERMRDRVKRWLAVNSSGTCDLSPRMTERQEGPRCVREKWLIQTEPGVWVPGYLVRPRGMLEPGVGPRPVLFCLHGSGPGKDGYAGDEELSPQRTQLGHELELLAYGLAVRLNCSVYVPDGRGQGELGETNPAQWQGRLATMGIANEGLRVLDQIRALDWLVTRPEIDASRVGSLGCSGGGGMTYLFAIADERIAASIVSSTTSVRLSKPLPEGYFRRNFAEAMTVDDRMPWPISGGAAGMLIAPRPLWIVDGLNDLLFDPAQRVAWRREMQEGRDRIREAYVRLGASDRYLDTWVEGGHCGGMTVDNTLAWFKRWFG